MRNMGCSLMLLILAIGIFAMNASDGENVLVLDDLPKKRR